MVCCTITTDARQNPTQKQTGLSIPAVSDETGSRSRTGLQQTNFGAGKAPRFGEKSAQSGQYRHAAHEGSSQAAYRGAAELLVRAHQGFVTRTSGALLRAFSFGPGSFGAGARGRTARRTSGPQAASKCFIKNAGETGNDNLFGAGPFQRRNAGRTCCAAGEHIVNQQDLVGPAAQCRLAVDRDGTGKRPLARPGAQPAERRRRLSPHQQIDAGDLKSPEPCSCGFESHRPHHTFRLARNGRLAMDRGCASIAHWQNSGR